MWILISAIPPFLWAFNNLADEYLAKHHFARHGLLLVILSACFEIIPGLASLALFDVAREVPAKDALALGVMGFWLSLSFFPYILAIQCSNANNAVPVFQLIPVLVFIFGWLFLGEGATGVQIAAGLLIIAASIGISWDYEEARFNVKSLSLMALSSCMIAIYLLAGRHYTFTYEPMAMMTWLWIGSGSLAIICVLANKAWRKQTKFILVRPLGVLTGVFFFQISSQILAGGVWIKALAVAPSAALMETIGGLQPAFVLILSILVGHMFPKYFERYAFERSIIFKFFLIFAMLFGVFLMSV
jgi:uncharacterized membrane protein